MANITRIKAKDPRKERQKQPEKAPPEPQKEPVEAKVEKASSNASKTNKPAKIAKQQLKPAKISDSSSKKPKNPIIRFITWPFRYLRESWLELRQVRWPSRGATWKMVLAVLFYTAIFIILIMLLDVFFTFIFNNLLAK